jgi:hypothetical protein
VLEAQQQAMDAHPDHQFYNLNIDAGSMWARRLIDQHGGQREQAPVAGDPDPAGWHESHGNKIIAGCTQIWSRGLEPQMALTAPR